MKAARSWWLVGALACLGCLEQVESPELGIPEVERALEGPVQLIDAGNWSVYHSRYSVEFFFWADIAVRNDAYNKTVGILWSRDHWQTVNTSYAVYEGGLPDGYERWGVDVNAGSSYPGQYEDIEYAVFAVMNNTTYWDSRNNYYVYNSVTPTIPVRRLMSEVHTEPGLGVVMTGKVRVLDLAYQKTVTVRYSYDNGANWQDVNATWDQDDDWSFRVENIPVDPMPAEVQYAVRYQVLGQEYWDNNGKQNFRHKLAPEFGPPYIPNEVDGGISGTFMFFAGFYSDLPNQGMEVRIDDAPWTLSHALEFSTAGMTDGEHRAGFRFLLPGYPAVTREVPFRVRNRVQPLDSWEPQFELNGTSQPLPMSWDMVMDATGRLYFTVDLPDGQRVVRFEGYGRNQGTLVYDRLENGGVIAVTPDGKLYVVTGFGVDVAMWRFNQDGHLDTSFGQQGHVTLSTSYNLLDVCYGGSLAASAHHLYMLDSCNNRVLRFDLAGNFVDSQHYGSLSNGLSHDGTSLWVVSMDGLYLFSDGPGVPLEMEGLIHWTPDEVMTSQAGVARAPDGKLWIAVSGGPALWVYSENERREAVWRSGVTGVTGGVQAPHSIVALPDGTMAVLSAWDTEVVRYKSELL